MKFKSIILVGFLICFGVAIFILVPFMTTSEIKAEAEKENLINALYLPKTATDIEVHGNGWVTFCFNGKGVVYFRHPVDHEIAMDLLP
ncbi:hypothetical protein KAU19_06765 [Candidatus Parcubacteria bacterium]|nr:hypothetical protein [Candidatus Parcubacteria bacterium]